MSLQRLGRGRRVATDRSMSPPWVGRRSLAFWSALGVSSALAPSNSVAAIPVGALLPLVELRGSIADATRDVEAGDVPKARSRLLKLISSRELFRTVVAQNTQRYLEDSVDDVAARAKNELRAVRTADRAVSKRERAELALNLVRSNGREPPTKDGQPTPREEALGALNAARASVEALLADASPRDVSQAEGLLSALRAADGDDDGIISDEELATLPATLRREAYDAQGVIANAASMSPRGDAMRKMGTGSRLFIGI